MQIPLFIDEIGSRVGNLKGISSVDIETDPGREWHNGMMIHSAHRQRDARKAAHIKPLEEKSRDTVSADYSRHLVAGCVLGFNAAEEITSAQGDRRNFIGSSLDNEY